MDGAFPSAKGQFGDDGAYGNGDMRPRGFRGTSENAKTKLCTRWMAGECRFGDRCNFAHGEEELRKLPPREGDRMGGGFGMGGPGRGYGGPPGRGYGGRGMGGFGGRGRGYDDYGYGGGGGGYGGGYGGPADHPGGYGGGGYGGGGPMGGGPMGGGPPRGGGGGGPVGRPAGMSEEAWAQQGYPVQGPNGWVMYRTKDTGESYFHNYQTNVTTWERPQDWPQGPPQ